MIWNIRFTFREFFNDQPCIGEFENFRTDSFLEMDRHGDHYSLETSEFICYTYQSTSF